MKIILSRKGFDSGYGKIASPILPDGTLLSMPIPTADKTTYESLSYKGKKYSEIIDELWKGHKKEFEGQTCHLDPDLRKDVKNRFPDWEPAFGQSGAALSHLRNMRVGEGDLFLFFGWFKETEIEQGKLKYKKKAKDLHVIYGYMQIGTIIERKYDAPDWLKEHPHIGDKNVRDDKNNSIYLPTKELSFIPNIKGCGLLNFRKDSVLTKDGMSKSKWNLPDCFKKVEISYHPNPWKGSYFKSADKGQEFVFDATPSIIEWVKQIIL